MFDKDGEIPGEVREGGKIMCFSVLYYTICFERTFTSSAVAECVAQTSRQRYAT